MSIYVCVVSASARSPIPRSKQREHDCNYVRPVPCHIAEFVSEYVPPSISISVN